VAGQCRRVQPRDVIGQQLGSPQDTEAQGSLPVL
jgi:hypothetical protein